ncbi:hypothetical protein MKY84_13575 [Chryseomicrobium sp. FSL W7-1435]|uniref:hypothetical protein n=1 Tax=Chryseomicrobium sp. FSL W7-1435 TaxID=2921704 RepID=UPI00315A6872
MTDTLVVFSIIVTIVSPFIFWYLKKKVLAILNFMIVVSMVTVFFNTMLGNVDTTNQTQMTIWYIGVLAALIFSMISFTLFAKTKWQLSGTTLGLGAVLVGVIYLAVVGDFSRPFGEWLDVSMSVAVPTYVGSMSLLALFQFDRRTVS